MKQAQIGQIIGYLLAIVIVAVTLLFGYKMVVSLRQQTEQASFLNFQKSLEADIKSIYFDFGSVKIESYSIGGYEEVCFIDSYPKMPNSVSTNNNIVDNSVSGGVKKNIFLIGDKIDSFYIDKVDACGTLCSDTSKCIPLVNGKLNIQLKGKGDYAEIS